MIVQSLSIMRQNYVFYITVIVLLLLVDFLDFYLASGGTSSNGAIACLWAILSMYVHNAVLYGGKFGEFAKRTKKSPMKGTMPFFFKNFGIILVVSIVTIVAGITVVGVPARDGMSGLWLLGLMVGMASVYALLLAAMGTWLPAGLYGLNTSLAQAFSRGRARFWKTFGRLLCVGYLSVISTTGMIVIMANTGSVELMVDAAPNLRYIVMACGTGLITAFGVTYTSVVLADNYMRAEGVMPVMKDGQLTEAAA